MQGSFLLRRRSAQDAVQEIDDDPEGLRLVKIFESVLAAVDDVILGIDAFFLQGLVKQLRLARRDRRIGVSVHDQERRRVLVDVSQRIGVAGRFRGVEDAAAPVSLVDCRAEESPGSTAKKGSPP